MILLKKIRVKALLFRIGVSADASCPLCQNADEWVEHLYFECEYARMCKNLLAHRLKVRLDPSSLEECNDALNLITGRFKRQVFQSLYAGLLYVIWKERNRAVWDKCIRCPEKVIEELLTDIRQRIEFVLPAKISRSNVEWFRKMMYS
ncbi:uncharacterized protein LOC110718657 [Chenopodium quinoa]|uniref:uncharacterized protein LOC110718657 n=1 Tax=Chenopodium quinoa TaxID=63459 RepID=UPI000B7839CD|nr:uncharacterized protein LOC110718657 [Chenopodium quinoa]